MLLELKCKYCKQKSFYNKAIVKINKDIIELYSYNTLVAIIKKSDNKTTYKLVNYNVNGKEKTTTTYKHQKEFFLQFGLDQEELKDLFKNNIYEKLEVK